MSAATPIAGNSFRSDATVITLVGFAHGTSHFFHFVLPPLFPWLMRDFGLTFTQVGAAMSVFFVVSGIGQALAGFVVDRVGALRVLYGGVALLSVGGLLYSAAQSYSMLLAAAAVAGLGNSVFHPADYTLLNRRVSASRLGHAFSVHGLTGSLGWAAAPSPWILPDSRRRGILRTQPRVISPLKSFEPQRSRGTNSTSERSSYGMITHRMA